MSSSTTEGPTAAVLTISDSSFRGEREDVSGPAVANLLREHRFEVVARHSGLGTAANLRMLMRRETGITPSAYKERFGPEISRPSMDG